MIKTMVILLALATPFSSAHADKVTGKVTVAVGDILYRAKDSSENKKYAAYGKGTREDTRAFVDMLTTALVKTRKFDVIERDRMAEVLKEQGMSIEGVANGGYEGGTFNLEGVDYIITGSITEYGEAAKGMDVGGFSTSSRIASMAVDVRILDVATGSIAIAETVRADKKSSSSIAAKGFVRGRSDSSGALLGEVMRETSTNVANLVVSSIYPVKVVAITKKGEIMLNYGKGFLSEGDILEVFSQGEVFVDPDTGDELGSEEELVAKISVFSVQARFSKARIVESSRDLEKGMIARLTEEKQSKKKKKKKKLW